MSNFKKILFAVIISCSMGAMSTYSTVATAAGKLRPNKLVVKDVLGSLNEAIDALENNEPKESILSYIQNARQFSKEITVGSLGAIVDRGADAIISSSRNVRNDDYKAARESLDYAVEEYTTMGKKTL